MMLETIYNGLNESCFIWANDVARVPDGGAVVVEEKIDESPVLLQLGEPAFPLVTNVIGSTSAEIERHAFKVVGAPAS